MRLTAPIAFSLSEQAVFLQPHRKFYQRLDSLADKKPDVAAASFLEPLGRWNALINAVSTYVSGAELDRVSARDSLRYEDSGVNWRVVEGYGTGIAAHGRSLPVVLSCPVQGIHHGGGRFWGGKTHWGIPPGPAPLPVPSAPPARKNNRVTPPFPPKSPTGRG